MSIETKNPEFLDPLKKNSGRVEKSENAATELSDTLSSQKLDTLEQKGKTEVTRVITELNQLRNNPILLEKKLNNPATLALLSRNGIPIEYVRNLLRDMRSIDQQELITQINDGNIAPIKIELSQKVEWLQQWYHELFHNLAEKAKSSIGPLSEDAPLIAQLQSEVLEAEQETDTLLKNISQIA